MADTAKHILISALVSVVCSLTVSSVAYFFFVPSVRDAEIRAGSLFSDGVYSIENADSSETDHCLVSVENHGPLTINNVTVTLRISPGSYKNVNMEIDPPRGKKEETTDGLVVNLGSLAPHDRVVAKLNIVAPSAPPAVLSIGTGRPSVLSNFSEWVSADGSPMTPVSWRYGGSSATGKFTLTIQSAPKKKPKSKSR